ncbi:O-antigen ligase family protein [bacterium 19MO02SH05]|uniref:O-antigen ligase family protein n=1 Tax=bacterium 19MO02SH05 TaxID=2920696 RepID=A0AAU6THP9_UNCXX|nr:O-antigen ligase family protein [Vibrio metschnikovii]
MNGIESKIGRLVKSKNYISLMLLCCMTFALTKLSYRYVSDIFQTILFIGTLLAFYIERHRVIKDKAFIIILASIFIPILSWINSKIFMPEHSLAIPKVSAIINFYFFFFIAFWLSGNKKYIYFFWASFVVGCILTTISHSENFLNDIILGLKGHRIDFAYINANHSAALFGMCTLLGVYYLPLIIKNNCRQYLHLEKFFYLFILLFCFFITLVTQSRQVWLAISISILIIILLKSFSLTKKRITIIYLAIGSLILLTSLISILNIPFVYNRVTQEFDVIPFFMSWDINQIPFTSMGIRLHFWFESIAWIKQYPLFGIGQNGRELVIALSENLPEYIINEFSHLHNGHIETIVNYGLLGYFSFITMFYYIIKSSNYYKESNEFLILSIVFISYFFIINMFESFLSFKSGAYLFNCIAAGVYSFKLKEEINQ